MRRALTLLACLLSFVCFAEPGDGVLSAAEKMRQDAAEKLPHVKAALGCKVLYDGIIFPKVLTTLPPEQEKELLGILAQLQMARQLNHIHDYDIDCDVDQIFTYLICTAPDGKQYSVDEDFIGFVGDTGDMSDCKDYELPDEKTYLRFCELVNWKNNKEAAFKSIVEANREYMAKKARELSDLHRASKCRLICRRENGDEDIPLSPEEESEILSILPRLQLAPAEVVIEGEVARAPGRYFILTCGDKEVELNPSHQIRPLCRQNERDNFPYVLDIAPYMLDDASFTRLLQLAHEDTLQAKGVCIYIGDKPHIESLKRAVAHIGYTLKDLDVKSNMRQTNPMPTRILSLSKNDKRQEAQLYLDATGEIYALFLTEKNSSPKSKGAATNRFNMLHIESKKIYGINHNDE